MPACAKYPLRPSRASPACAKYRGVVEGVIWPRALSTPALEKGRAPACAKYALSPSIDSISRIEHVETVSHGSRVCISHEWVVCFNARASVQ